ncbi:protein kinase, partial [Acidobacteria bacterium AH-259-G07]|nr:protein kinase [Acidobacteria bacterium AH-259-G07]
EKVAKGPLPVEEALEVCRQIADGVEAAHEKGVIHRDLKPANVKITPEGQVKVLDFGLAKALEGGKTPKDISDSPTLSMAATQAGIILGTAAYMSPEQAKGNLVDKRTDIWAFGCVLFEMLTGERPFSGQGVAEIVAAVIQSQPHLDRLHPVAPHSVRQLVARCLKKDPRRRLRDIGDARNELEEIQSHLGDEPDSPLRTPSRPFLTVLPWVLVVLLGVSALALLLRQQKPTVPDLPLRRFAIDLPWHSVPNWTDFIAALSRRGTHIAYNGRVYNQVDVYVRALDSLESHALVDARETDQIVFSHDGEWIGFLNRSELRKVSIHGGQSLILSNLEDLTGFFMGGLSWGPDGDILIGTSSGLYRVPDSGGTPEAVTQVHIESGEDGHLRPSHLPGGKAALLTISRNQQDPQLAVVDLANGALKPLPLFGDHPVYSPSGHIMFRQESTVYAALFDVKNLASGDPIPILEGVRRGPYLSADGTLLYIPVRGESNARLVWVDRSGRPTPIAGERLNYSHLDLSEEGGAALLNIDSDVYVLDLERGTRQLLSSGSFPIWTVDGLHATFRSNEGLVKKIADDSAEAESLMTGLRGVPTSWNPRSGDLAFFDDASDIWVLPRGGKPKLFLKSPSNERTGRFSPDGQWIAYISDETGEYQVYVVPYPGPGPKIPVSINGGLSPIWAPDGGELFFRKGGKVLAAPVTYKPELRIGQPVELFEGSYTLDLMGHQRYDIAPDGQKFLMVENSDDFRIVIVQNWIDELRRLVPTGE